MRKQRKRNESIKSKYKQSKSRLYRRNNKLDEEIKIYLSPKILVSINDTIKQEFFPVKKDTVLFLDYVGEMIFYGTKDPLLTVDVYNKMKRLKIPTYLLYLKKYQKKLIDDGWRIFFEIDDKAGQYVYYLTKYEERVYFDIDYDYGEIFVYGTQNSEEITKMRFYNNLHKFVNLINICNEDINFISNKERLIREYDIIIYDFMTFKVLYTN